MKKELSTQTINIIKNSANIIASNGEKITLRMYEIVFNKYPHIEKMFENAPDNQYMKLADALTLYAVNIDKLHVLAPALEVIAKTHIDTGVKQLHYVMIGQSLIKAMYEVLGDMATPTLIDAWREAYIYISDVLIEMENELYKSIST
ncbi:MAG: globin domain-containing protein [Campylobacterota bacterium]|nr:globin domain-containing protein [Campylobacterota bacterium]